LIILDYLKSIAVLFGAIFTSLKHKIFFGKLISASLASFAAGERNFSSRHSPKMFFYAIKNFFLGPRGKGRQGYCLLFVANNS
jgi:hypothetical protein